MELKKKYVEMMVKTSIDATHETLSTLSLSDLEDLMIELHLSSNRKTLMEDIADEYLEQLLLKYIDQNKDYYQKLIYEYTLHLVRIE